MTDAQSRGLVLAFSDASTAVDVLIRTAGHVVSEHQRLTEDGRWEDLGRDLVAFVYRRAGPCGNQVHLALEYLLATARRESHGSF